jgi:CRP-like cAMP-binding protein/CheY-like chemotaxis protein
MPNKEQWKSMSKILVVEDELFIADELKASLQDLGYTVFGPCNNGKDALDIVKTSSPDLVLMDIEIEGEIDGIQTAEKIRENFDTPIVFLTAYADDKTLDRASVTQPYGYILKPASDLELRTAIELALRKKAQKKKLREESPSKSSLDLSDYTENSNSATNELYDVLKQFPQFEEVDTKVLRCVASRCRFSDYKTGESLAFEGDDNVDGFIVVSGRVSMKRSSESGKELVVESLPAGSTFGLGVAAAWNPYPVRAEAQGATKALWMPRARVKELLELFPKFSQLVLNDVFARLRSSHDTSRGLAHDRVELRIASALIELSSSEADSEQSEIHMTRQELADSVGTTLETAVRITKTMERSGWLNLKKRGLIRITNRGGLTRFIDEYTA